VTVEIDLPQKLRIRARGRDNVNSRTVYAVVGIYIYIYTTHIHLLSDYCRLCDLISFHYCFRTQLSPVELSARVIEMWLKIVNHIYAYRFRGLFSAVKRLKEDFR